MKPAFEYCWITEKPAEDKTLLNDRLNVYGQEGWELVSVVRSADTQRCAFFFKRPVPPSISK